MQWDERDAHVVVNGLNHLSGMTVDAVSMNNALTAILWGDGNQQVPEAMWDSAGQLLEKWVQSCNGDDEESIRAAIKVINSHKVRCDGARAAAHAHRARHAVTLMVDCLVFFLRTSQPTSQKDCK